MRVDANGSNGSTGQQADTQQADASASFSQAYNTAEAAQSSQGSATPGWQETSTLSARSHDTGKTESGHNSRRQGPVVKNAKVWEGDPLAQYRGPVNGQPTQGAVLSNPNRTDGLAIHRGADPTGTFSKDHGTTAHRDLVYTEGNTFQDGRGGTVPGTNIVGIENRTDGGVLFAASHSPGFEQPGQALTPVKVGQDGQFVPTPSHTWLNDVGLSKYAQPEVWVSVTNVDPATVEGWHLSGARPDNDPNRVDYGTPAFPYMVNVIDKGPNEMPFFGMSSNEGFDPVLTGDPGYGMMLEATRNGKTEVVGAVVISGVDGNTGTAVGWADNTRGGHAFVNHQGGVTVAGALDGALGRSAFGSPTTTYKMVLAPKDEVQAFIEEQQANGAGVSAQATHRSVNTPR